MKREVMGLMPDAKIVTYENRSHNLSQEIPNEIAEELKIFF